MLFQSAPAAPPQNPTVTDVYSTAIGLMWEEVPAMEQNGIITEYEVQYRQSTFESIPLTQSVNVSAPTLTLNLTGLEEDVNYSIRIRAFTAVGPGPYTIDINSTTSQDGEFCILWYLRHSIVVIFIVQLHQCLLLM